MKGGCWRGPPLHTQRQDRGWRQGIAASNVLAPGPCLLSSSPPASTLRRHTWMERLKQPSLSPDSESAPQHMTMAPGWYSSMTWGRYNVAVHHVRSTKRRVGPQRRQRRQRVQLEWLRELQCSHRARQLPAPSASPARTRTCSSRRPCPPAAARSRCTACRPRAPCRLHGFDKERDAARAVLAGRPRTCRLGQALRRLRTRP